MTNEDRTYMAKKVRKYDELIEEKQNIHRWLHEIKVVPKDQTIYISLSSSCTRSIAMKDRLALMRFLELLEEDIDRAIEAL